MKETDIRPEALLRRYLTLCQQDAESCFRGVGRIDVPCVACGEAASVPQFEKDGFAYALCSGCGTLFQTPRPVRESFEAFYQDSESSRFWAEEFFPAVMEIRRHKIFVPRVERLAALCREHGIAVSRLIDVGAGFGLLLEEWRRLFPSTEGVAVEPSPEMAAICRAKGLTVAEVIVEKAVGHLPPGDLVTSFEVLEHVYDPLQFVRALVHLVDPGGYVFVSTLGIDGFDLQVLWEKSTQISPPHHLNFLSLRGFERLFERAGLVDVVISTPGALDVDIVRNARKANPDLLAGQRFLSHVLDDDAASANFQEFLRANRLSSHVWILGRRPLAGEVR